MSLRTVLLGRQTHVGNEQLHIQKLARVLVVRVDELGDLVMTTPFLKELRRNLPNGWITLVVQPSLKNLVELCPYVSEVLTFDWRANRFLYPFQRLWRIFNLARGHLWRRRYDLAILPRWDTDHYYGTHILNLSGARWRVAYSEQVSPVKRVKNAGFDRLVTHALDGSRHSHEVERNLDMIRFLGGSVRDRQLEIWIGDDDDAFAEEVLKKYRVTGDTPVIAFGPSGGHSALKQWPARYFGLLGAYLREQYRARIVIFGADGEQDLGREIEALMGPWVINLIGKTTLRQTAALLRRCHLFVGNDAGPMHMASAANVPVVALFGSSCSHRFSPWNEPHMVLCLDLPCHPCLQEQHPDRCMTCLFGEPRCMFELPLERVKQAIAQLLDAKCSKSATTSTRSVACSDLRKES